MIDWNWFFAALAQSAAAIVGIFGAFLVTKVLTNQSLFVTKLNRLRELHSECLRIVDRANDLPFYWYNNAVAEEALEELKKLLEEDDTKTPEEYFAHLTFSIYDEKGHALNYIESAIQRHSEEKREAARREAELAVGRLGGFDWLNRLPEVEMGTRVGLWREIEAQREFIESVFRDAKHQVRVVQNHLDSVKDDPEYSPQVTHILILATFLFYVGVIYPLGFLPIAQNASMRIEFSAILPTILSFKGALLAVVSTLFTAIAAIFFWINLKLKYPVDEVRELQKFVKIESYSKYFQTRELNFLKSLADALRSYDARRPSCGTGDSPTA